MQDGNVACRSLGSMNVILLLCRRPWTRLDAFTDSPIPISLPRAGGSCFREITFPIFLPLIIRPEKLKNRLGSVRPVESVSLTEPGDALYATLLNMAGFRPGSFHAALLRLDFRFESQSGARSMPERGGRRSASFSVPYATWAIPLGATVCPRSQDTACRNERNERVRGNKEGLQCFGESIEFVSVPKSNIEARPNTQSDQETSCWRRDFKRRQQDYCEADLCYFFLLNSNRAIAENGTDTTSEKVEH